MRAAERRSIGATGVELSRLGVGAGTLSHVDGAAALHAALDRARAHGLSFVDTAPLYLSGASERHVGEWLASVDRAQIVLSTKVGRLANDATGSRRFDYGANAVRTSVQDSLERLGTDHLELVVVHDLDRGMHDAQFDDQYARVVAECWPALVELREAGVVRAIGVSTRQSDVARRILDDLAPDALMMAGAYTLLAHAPSADLLPECQARDVAVIIASPFNSGILATGDPDSTFDYAPASAAVRARLAALLEVGERHGVQLAHAALQFPLRHPAVASVLAGHRTAAEIDRNVAGMQAPIPEGYWDELAHVGLLPELTS